MLTLHILSPQNEVEVAKGLEAAIRRAWPEEVADPNDRIDLLVGVRTGAAAEVDLLIALDLETPRPIPADSASPRPRRPDSHMISSGLIAVEIKQLDASRFEPVGDRLFSYYKGVRSRRSVSDQARDGAYAIKNFASSSGFPNLYVYALAWLTALDPAQLKGVDPIVAGKTDWRGILTTACAQNPSLLRPHELTRRGVRAVRDRLLNRRTLTPLDRFKFDRIGRDALIGEIVADLAPRAGSATIRLAGHGGSGKTTALVLLAARLATHHGARVLILTFHHALCGDLRHLLEGMPGAYGHVGDTIHVETATSFLLSLVQAAGGDIPYKDDGTTLDFEQTDVTFRTVAAALGPYSERGNGDAVIGEDRQRFAWDHVLIDEAQDWTDAERDLLIAVYGTKRLVLADGLVQLMRRAASCNWLRDVPPRERLNRNLDQSLRMQHNIALFATAVARTIGFSDWSVKPHADLPGGRVIILEGELADPAALVHAVRTVAANGKADPVDNLICVPHSEIVREEGGGRHARIAAALRGAGDAVWDASDPLTRTIAPEGSNAWRIVQYDSCRGLEGWATLLIALDDLYANRLKHPNVGTAERAIDPQLVARRWLLIPLTRAVHLLVIHVRDPASPVAAMLREAASQMPKRVVEWYPANEGVTQLLSGAT